MEERLKRAEEQIDTLIEFKGETQAHLKHIMVDMTDIKENELRHLNKKINILLFTVLASVFASIIVLGIKAILKL